MIETTEDKNRPVDEEVEICACVRTARYFDCCGGPPACVGAAGFVPFSSAWTLVPGRACIETVDDDAIRSPPRPCFMTRQIFGGQLTERHVFDARVS